MQTTADTELAHEFGQVIGIEKARTLVAEAAAMAGLGRDGPYTTDERIQLCTMIENNESGVVANTAHEIRIRSEIEKHFEGLFGVLPDPAMIVTREYGGVSVITANDVARGTFAFPESTGTDPSLETVVGPIDRDEFEMRVYRHLARGDQFREHLSIQDNEQARHFVARFSPIGREQLASGEIETPTGSEQQGVLVFTEITDQKRRQQNIEQLQQVTEVMNRVLRHNLRNAMTTVLGRADLLKAESQTETVIDSAEIIEETGTKLIEISRNARVIQECVETVDREDVDLISLVTGHLETHADRYDDAEIRTDMPAEAPVVADSNLDYILENAIRNGIEHNDSTPPVIDISVTVDHDEVVLVIADNGPGIPDHELAVLDRGFESPLKHGTGLGIWLIFWIVEQYGGTVSFEERDPTGTRVVVRLQSPDG